MHQDLTAAIDDLYRAFACYPLMDDVSYCVDHCVTAEEVAALHRTPLREVTMDQMLHLASNVGTWGDDAYFHHFVPRYLELAALPGGRWVWMFGRPSSAWVDTTEECQAAVDVFMWQWWRHAASSPIDADQAGARDVLSAIGECGRRVDSYLAGWPTGVHADLQLAATVRDLYRSVESDDQFWRDVNAWLYGPVPLARLTAALLDASMNGLALDDIELLTEVRDLHRNSSGIASADQSDPRTR